MTENRERTTAEAMMSWAVLAAVLLAGVWMNLPNRHIFEREQGWPSTFHRKLVYDAYSWEGSSRPTFYGNAVCIFGLAVIFAVATQMLLAKRYSLKLMLLLTLAISLTLGAGKIASRHAVGQPDPAEDPYRLFMSNYPPANP